MTHHRHLHQIDGLTAIPDRGHDPVTFDLKKQLYQHFDAPRNDDTTQPKQDAAAEVGFSPTVQSDAFTSGVDTAAIDAFLDDVYTLLNGTGFDTNGTPILLYKSPMIANKYLGEQTPGWCGVATDIHTNPDGTVGGVQLQELQTLMNYRRRGVRNTTTPARTARPDNTSLDGDGWMKPFILDTAWWLCPPSPDQTLRLTLPEDASTPASERATPEDTDIYLHTPGPAQYTMRFLADAPPAARDALEALPNTNLPAALAIEQAPDNDGDWLIANHTFEETLTHLLEAGWTVALSQVVETRYFTPAKLPIDVPPAPWQPDAP